MTNYSMTKEGDEVKKMSSLEIAELVESRHDHVKRSVERLATKGVIQLPPMGEVKNHLGQTVSVYEIDKRSSYIIVAQLSPEFTARLVDRWQELEAQVAKPQHQIPETFSQALALAAKQAEQLELQAPKVAFVEQFVESKGSKTITEVAKIFNVRRVELIAFLTNKKMIYRLGGNLVPYANVKKGIFEVKTGTAKANDHAYTQTRITPLGIEYIAHSMGITRRIAS